VAFELRYVTDDVAALRLAAEPGTGIGQLPVCMVSEQLRTGSLVAVLPDWESTSGIIHAVFLSRRDNLQSCEALSISPVKPSRPMAWIRPDLTEVPRIQIGRAPPVSTNRRARATGKCRSNIQADRSGGCCR
jgi:hypothetical protein